MGSWERSVSVLVKAASADQYCACQSLLTGSSCVSIMHLGLLPSQTDRAANNVAWHMGKSAVNLQLNSYLPWYSQTIDQILVRPSPHIFDSAGETKEWSILQLWLD
jgi:hypothetical protein